MRGEHHTTTSGAGRMTFPDGYQVFRFLGESPSDRTCGFIGNITIKGTVTDTYIELLMKTVEY